MDTAYKASVKWLEKVSGQLYSVMCVKNEMVQIRIAKFESNYN